MWGYSKSKEQAYPKTPKKNKLNRVKASTKPTGKSLKSIKTRYEKNKLGVGARIKLTKVFGLKEIPVGTMGTVVDHFGGGKDNPIVKFDGYNGNYSVGLGSIDLVKGSTIFTNDFVTGNGSPQQLKRKLLSQYWRFSDGGGNYVSGYVTGCDEGYDFNIPFSVELSNNRAKIRMLKTDIPNKLRWLYDEYLEEARDIVENAIR